ncbi:hypothetical protein [Lacinutrix sp. Hel_I_90]|uniref:hypothetical protein n=1 Tax=Lacinutrix sp. Hel_I_90 TaxID=1249999 RepID=UPI000A3E1634|nr:hypothetical protein [Lacinutrix sp. Hel_I_90]
MAFTTLPSILVFVDNSIDISFLMNVSEEEEEKGNTKNKELEVFVSNTSLGSDHFSNSETEDNVRYTYKKYSKPHLNLISPPPEFI